MQKHWAIVLIPDFIYFPLQSINLEILLRSLINHPWCTSENLILSMRIFCWIMITHYLIVINKLVFGIVSISICIYLDLFECVVIKKRIFFIHVQLLSEGKQQRFAKVVVHPRSFLRLFTTFFISIHSILIMISLVLRLNYTFVWT